MRSPRESTTDHRRGTSAPLAPLVPEWPEYDTADRATLIYHEECRVEHDPTGEIRRYWEGRDG